MAAGPLAGRAGGCSRSVKPKLFDTTGQNSIRTDPCPQPSQLLLLHAGMTDAFVWDAGTPRARMTSHSETEQLLEEIDAKFKSECTHLIYHHKVGCAPVIARSLTWLVALY